MNTLGPLVASGTAALLSFAYLLGWCILNDLSLVQIRRVVWAARGPTGLLTLLDSLRAAALGVVVWSGVVGGEEPIDNLSGGYAAAAWAGVGVASFFVTVRLPPTVGFASVRGDDDDGAQASRGSPRESNDDHDTRWRRLYAPSIGMFKALRRNAVARFTKAVAGERSQQVTLDQARSDRAIMEVFPRGASGDDVLRTILECRTYLLAGEGVIPASTSGELRDYLELLELNLLRFAGTSDAEEHKQTIVAILHRLTRDGLHELRTQILETTGKVREAAAGNG